jgi:adenine-specific DNA-methyltransferase
MDVTEQRRATHAGLRPGARREPGGGTIWYMGAKTRLFGALERAIGPLLERASARPPVFADLFTGTGAVAARFADRARVLANDAQHYSAVLARAVLVPAPGAAEGIERVIARGREAARALVERSGGKALLAEEARFLSAEAPDLEAYRRFVAQDIAREDPEREAAALRAAGVPALIWTYHRHVYFGARQAAAIDGLRAAIEGATEPERTAYLAALLFAASRATSATAHFAQPRPMKNDSEVKTMIRRRRIDIEALFRARVEWLAREGGRRFAGRNEVFSLPWEAFFARAAGPIDVVYADPPYTRDQYSRFYHVLESIVDYDYPPLARNARGKVLMGRYPAIERRFQSRFASPAAVEDEFRGVTRAAAACGAALVWSYSTTNGLLFERWKGALGPFEALLRESYAHVRIEEHPLFHSGQGDRNHAANEIVAVCTGPR